MSDRVFWLLISTTIIMICILLMLLGWGLTDRGGLLCVTGVLAICAGGSLAGFTKEDREDKRKR